MRCYSSRECSGPQTARKAARKRASSSLWKFESKLRVNEFFFFQFSPFKYTYIMGRFIFNMFAHRNRRSRVLASQLVAFIISGTINFHSVRVHVQYVYTYVVHFYVLFLFSFIIVVVYEDRIIPSVLSMHVHKIVCRSDYKKTVHVHTVRRSGTMATQPISPLFYSQRYAHTRSLASQLG